MFNLRPTGYLARVGAGKAESYRGQMAESGETRASDNPRYAVDSTSTERERAGFVGHGRQLVDTFLDPALARLRFDPRGRRVLEIGCGVGGLFTPLHERFSEVWGIDVSTTMVELGQRHCPTEARWFLGDGVSLQGIPDRSVDYVVSFEVFQHLPDESVIVRYIGEIARVLRGGAFQLQMRQGSDSRRQAAVRFLPRPMRSLAGNALRRARVLPVGGDIGTWLGCVVPIARGIELCRDARLVEALRDGMHPDGMGYWLIGRAA